MVQTVSKVMLHGEKTDLGAEMTTDEVKSHLKDMGMGHVFESRQDVVQGDTLMFQQQNAEKGSV